MAAAIETPSKPNTTGTLLMLFTLTLVYLSDTGKLSKAVAIIKGPALPAPSKSGNSLLQDIAAYGLIGGIAAHTLGSGLPSGSTTGTGGNTGSSTDPTGGTGTSGTGSSGSGSTGTGTSGSGSSGSGSSGGAASGSAGDNSGGGDG